MLNHCLFAVLQTRSWPRSTSQASQSPFKERWCWQRSRSDSFTSNMLRKTTSLLYCEAWPGKADLFYNRSKHPEATAGIYSLSVITVAQCLLWLWPEKGQFFTGRAFLVLQILIKPKRRVLRGERWLLFIQQLKKRAKGHRGVIRSRKEQDLSLKMCDSLLNKSLPSTFYFHHVKFW